MSQPQTQSQPQPAQLTFINMPPAPSNPDTPSEMPGTPTSTTTSLSALSTIAIKDGQRGGHIPLAGHGGSGSGSGGSGGYRGHHHHPSTNSLEAERADRISRLTGLSSVSTLRPLHGGGGASVARASLTSGGSRLGSRAGGEAPATPTSGSYVHGSASGHGHGHGVSLSAVPGPLTPAFFDAHGQPMAMTKMSTVGTASATESATASVTASATTSVSNSSGTGHTLGDTVDEADGESRAYMDDDDAMMMDDDMDPLDHRSSGFEDRMSDVDDDGVASLVGFGEGAGSTISGPIYQRRAGGPPAASSAGAILAAQAHWSLERTISGLSDVAVAGSAASMTSSADNAYTTVWPTEQDDDVAGAGHAGQGGLAAPPHPASQAQYAQGQHHAPIVGSIQAQPSALRETQRPRSHQQQQQQQQQWQQQWQQQAQALSASGAAVPTRERLAAEQILRSVGRLEGGPDAAHDSGAVPGALNSHSPSRARRSGR